MRLHRYKEAIESLEKVIELARPEDLIYQAIGYCYEKIKNYAQARFYYRKASHLNPDDAKIYLKVAGTYIKESKHALALKYLDTALRIKRLDPEFNLTMGECLVKVGKLREAVHYFMAAVQARPKNIKSWEALSGSLFVSAQYKEAQKQVEMARIKTGNKPMFDYYDSAILLSMGNIKPGLDLLESSIESHPRLLKKFLKLYPSSVKFPQVVELILKNKRRKRI
jgi:tetratricopeptide (TPR) repeat protein